MLTTKQAVPCIQEEEKTILSKLIDSEYISLDKLNLLYW